MMRSALTTIAFGSGLGVMINVGHWLGVILK